MGFCITCGNQHHDGVRFCRFCGTGQPSEQLLARLRAEAEQIRLIRMQMQQAQAQNDAYARLEAMRQQAEAAARINNQQNQNYRPPSWWYFAAQTLGHRIVKTNAASSACSRTRTIRNRRRPCGIFRISYWPAWYHQRKGCRRFGCWKWNTWYWMWHIRCQERYFNRRRSPSLRYCSA
mgnify:CR=1 FL=1